MYEEKWEISSGKISAQHNKQGHQSKTNSWTFFQYR